MNLGVLQHRYDTNATTTGLRLLRQKSADELNNRILLGRRSSLVLDLVVFTSKLKKKKNRGDDINHLLRSRGGEVEGDRLPTATGHSCPPASLRACPAGTPRPRRPRTTTTRRGPAAAGAGASTGSSTAARRGSARAPRSRARPRGRTRTARSTRPCTPPEPRPARQRPRTAPPRTRRSRARAHARSGRVRLDSSSRSQRAAPSSSFSSSASPPWRPCPWRLACFFAFGAGDSTRRRGGGEGAEACG
jgi:hypothetical protein